MKSTQEMVVHETQSQSKSNHTTRTALPLYSMLPSALQTGLHPLASVGRSLSDYSHRSRRRVTSLVMSRSESEDTLMAGDEMAVASSCSVDSAEVSGICWKFARHGKILHTKGPSP